MPAPSNSFTPVTSPPDHRPLRATLQASYHSSLQGLRVRGDDHNTLSPSSLRACWKRALEPDDRGDHPSGDKVLLAPPPPPIDLAEQLLSRSFRSALSQLSSGHCSWLQAYHHSVDWADDPTCPYCRSTDHTVAHLFYSSTHPTDLAPGDRWTAPLHFAKFLAGVPLFSDLPPLQVDFDSFPP